MGEKSGPDFDGDLGLFRKEKTVVVGAMVVHLQACAHRATENSFLFLKKKLTRRRNPSES